MTEVTPRQLLILRSISAHIEENGFPPSTTWIRDASGLSSEASVQHQLGRLEAKGLIARVPRLNRALRQVLTPGVVTVPVRRCEACQQDMPVDHACRSATGPGHPSDYDTP